MCTVVALCAVTSENIWVIAACYHGWVTYLMIALWFACVVTNNSEVNLMHMEYAVACISHWNCSTLFTQSETFWINVCMGTPSYYSLTSTFSDVFYSSLQSVLRFSASFCMNWQFLLVTINLKSRLIRHQYFVLVLLQIWDIGEGCLLFQSSIISGEQCIVGNSTVAIHWVYDYLQSDGPALYRMSLSIACHCEQHHWQI